jgi:hypothetical protein
MRILTSFLAAALLCGAPLGDSFAQRGAAPPRLAVQSLEPLPSNAGEQSFRAVLLVDNMNTEPMKIRNIEFQMRLGNHGILDGHTGPLMIEALDQQTVVLELTSQIVASLSYLSQFAEGPDNTLPYEIFGKLTLDRRRIDPIQFGGKGRVPLVMSGDR